MGENRIAGEVFTLFVNPFTARFKQHEQKERDDDGSIQEEVVTDVTDLEPDALHFLLLIDRQNSSSCSSSGTSSSGQHASASPYTTTTTAVRVIAVDTEGGRLAHSNVMDHDVFVYPTLSSSGLASSLFTCVPNDHQPREQNLESGDFAEDEVRTALARTRCALADRYCPGTLPLAPPVAPRDQTLQQKTVLSGHGWRSLPFVGCAGGWVGTAGSATDPVASTLATQNKNSSHCRDGLDDATAAAAAATSDVYQHANLVDDALFLLMVTAVRPALQTNSNEHVVTRGEGNGSPPQNNPCFEGGCSPHAAVHRVGRLRWIRVRASAPWPVNAFFDGPSASPSLSSSAAALSSPLMKTNNVINNKIGGGGTPLLAPRAQLFSTMVCHPSRGAAEAMNTIPVNDEEDFSSISFDPTTLLRQSVKKKTSSRPYHDHGSSDRSEFLLNADMLDALKSLSWWNSQTNTNTSLHSLPHPALRCLLQCTVKLSAGTIHYVPMASGTTKRDENDSTNSDLSLMLVMRLSTLGMMTTTTSLGSPSPSSTAPIPNEALWQATAVIRSRKDNIDNGSSETGDGGQRNVTDQRTSRTAASLAAPPFLLKVVSRTSWRSGMVPTTWGNELAHHLANLLQHPTLAFSSSPSSSTSPNIMRTSALSYLTHLKQQSSRSSHPAAAAAAADPSSSSFEFCSIDIDEDLFFLTGSQTHHQGSGGRRSCDGATSAGLLWLVTSHFPRLAIDASFPYCSAPEPLPLPPPASTAMTTTAPSPTTVFDAYRLEAEKEEKEVSHRYTTFTQDLQQEEQDERFVLHNKQKIPQKERRPNRNNLAACPSRPPSLREQWEPLPWYAPPLGNEEAAAKTATAGTTTTRRYCFSYPATAVGASPSLCTSTSTTSGGCEESSVSSSVQCGVRAATTDVMLAASAAMHVFTHLLLPMAMTSNTLVVPRKEQEDTYMNTRCGDDLTGSDEGSWILSRSHRRQLIRTAVQLVLSSSSSSASLSQHQHNEEEGCHALQEGTTTTTTGSREQLLVDILFIATNTIGGPTCIIRSRIRRRIARYLHNSLLHHQVSCVDSCGGIAVAWLDRFSVYQNMCGRINNASADQDRSPHLLLQRQRQPYNLTDPRLLGPPAPVEPSSLQLEEGTSLTSSSSSSPTVVTAAVVVRASVRCIGMDGRPVDVFSLLDEMEAAEDDNEEEYNNNLGDGQDKATTVRGEEEEEERGASYSLAMLLESAIDDLEDWMRRKALLPTSTSTSTTPTPTPAFLVPNGPPPLPWLLFLPLPFNSVKITIALPHLSLITAIALNINSLDPGRYLNQQQLYRGEEEGEEDDSGVDGETLPPPPRPFLTATITTGTYVHDTCSRIVVAKAPLPLLSTDTPPTTIMSAAAGAGGGEGSSTTDYSSSGSGMRMGGKSTVFPLYDPSVVVPPLSTLLYPTIQTPPSNVNAATATAATGWFASASPPASAAATNDASAAAATGPFYARGSYFNDRQPVVARFVTIELRGALCGSAALADTLLRLREMQKKNEERRTTEDGSRSSTTNAAATISSICGDGGGVFLADEQDVTPLVKIYGVALPYDATESPKPKQKAMNTTTMTTGNLSSSSLFLSVDGFDHSGSPLQQRCGVAAGGTTLSLSMVGWVPRCLRLIPFGPIPVVPASTSWLTRWRTAYVEQQKQHQQQRAAHRDNKKNKMTTNSSRKRDKRRDEENDALRRLFLETQTSSSTGKKAAASPLLATLLLEDLLQLTGTLSEHSNNNNNNNNNINSALLSPVCPSNNNSGGGGASQASSNNNSLSRRLLPLLQLLCDEAETELFFLDDLQHKLLRFAPESHMAPATLLAIPSAARSGFLPSSTSRRAGAAASSLLESQLGHSSSKFVLVSSSLSAITLRRRSSGGNLLMLSTRGGGGASPRINTARNHNNPLTTGRRGGNVNNDDEDGPGPLLTFRSQPTALLTAWVGGAGSPRGLGSAASPRGGGGGAGGVSETLNTARELIHSHHSHQSGSSKQGTTNRGNRKEPHPSSGHPTAIEGDGGGGGRALFLADHLLRGLGALSISQLLQAEYLRLSFDVSRTSRDRLLLKGMDIPPWLLMPHTGLMFAWLAAVRAPAPLQSTVVVMDSTSSNGTDSGSASGGVSSSVGTILPPAASALVSPSPFLLSASSSSIHEQWLSVAELLAQKKVLRKAIKEEEKKKNKEKYNKKVGEGSNATSGGGMDSGTSTIASSGGGGGAAVPPLQLQPPPQNNNRRTQSVQFHHNAAAETMTNATRGTTTTQSNAKQYSSSSIASTSAAAAAAVAAAAKISSTPLPSHAFLQSCCQNVSPPPPPSSSSSSSSKGAALVVGGTGSASASCCVQYHASASLKVLLGGAGNGGATDPSLTAPAGAGGSANSGTTTAAGSSLSSSPSSSSAIPLALLPQRRADLLLRMTNACRKLSGDVYCIDHFYLPQRTMYGNGSGGGGGGGTVTTTSSAAAAANAANTRAGAASSSAPSPSGGGAGAGPADEQNFFNTVNVFFDQNTTPADKNQKIKTTSTSASAQQGGAKAAGGGGFFSGGWFKKDAANNNNNKSDTKQQEPDATAGAPSGGSSASNSSKPTCHHCGARLWSLSHAIFSSFKFGSNATSTTTATTGSSHSQTSPSQPQQDPTPADPHKGLECHHCRHLFCLKCIAFSTTTSASPNNTMDHGGNSSVQAYGFEASLQPPPARNSGVRILARGLVDPVARCCVPCARELQGVERQLHELHRRRRSGDLLVVTAAAAVPVNTSQMEEEDEEDQKHSSSRNHNSTANKSFFSTTTLPPAPASVTGAEGSAADGGGDVAEAYHLSSHLQRVLVPPPIHPMLRYPLLHSLLEQQKEPSRSNASLSHISPWRRVARVITLPPLLQFCDDNGDGEEAEAALEKDHRMDRRVVGGSGGSSSHYTYSSSTAVQAAAAPPPPHTALITHSGSARCAEQPKQVAVIPVVPFEDIVSVVIEEEKEESNSSSSHKGSQRAVKHQHHLLQRSWSVLGLDEGYLIGRQQGMGTAASDVAATPAVIDDQKATTTTALISSQHKPPTGVVPQLAMPPQPRVDPASSSTDGVRSTRAVHVEFLLDHHRYYCAPATTAARRSASTCSSVSSAGGGDAITMLSGATLFVTCVSDTRDAADAAAASTYTSRDGSHEGKDNNTSNHRDMDNGSGVSASVLTCEVFGGADRTALALLASGTITTAALLTPTTFPKKTGDHHRSKILQIISLPFFLAGGDPETTTGAPAPAVTMPLVVFALRFTGPLAALRCLRVHHLCFHKHPAAASPPPPLSLIAPLLRSGVRTPTLTAGTTTTTAIGSSSSSSVSVRVPGPALAMAYLHALVGHVGTHLLPHHRSLPPLPPSSLLPTLSGSNRVHTHKACIECFTGHWLVPMRQRVRRRTLRVAGTVAQAVIKQHLLLVEQQQQQPSQEEEYGRSEITATNSIGSGDAAAALLLWSHDACSDGLPCTDRQVPTLVWGAEKGGKEQQKEDRVGGSGVVLESVREDFVAALPVALTLSHHEQRRYQAFYQRCTSSTSTAPSHKSSLPASSSSCWVVPLLPSGCVQHRPVRAFHTHLLATDQHLYHFDLFLDARKTTSAANNASTGGEINNPNNATASGAGAAASAGGSMSAGGFMLTSTAASASSSSSMSLLQSNLGCTVSGIVLEHYHPQLAALAAQRHTSTSTRSIQMVDSQDDPLISAAPQQKKKSGQDHSHKSQTITANNKNSNKNSTKSTSADSASPTATATIVFEEVCTESLLLRAPIARVIRVIGTTRSGAQDTLAVLPLPIRPADYSYPVFNCTSRNGNRNGGTASGDEEENSSTRRQQQEKKPMAADLLEAGGASSSPPSLGSGSAADPARYSGAAPLVLPFPAPAHNIVSIQIEVLDATPALYRSSGAAATSGATLGKTTSVDVVVRPPPPPPYLGQVSFWAAGGSNEGVSTTTSTTAPPHNQQQQTSQQKEVSSGDYISRLCKWTP